MTGSVPNTETSAALPLAADAALALPVWDLPIRIFHWSLVALVGFSWWSAENHHLQWHMWSGYAVMFALLFRILWGFVGSSTARFASFVRGPRGVLGYIRAPDSWRRVGHTPLGAASVVALLGLIVLQVSVGLFSADDDLAGPLNHLVDYETADLAKDIHEALFNVLLGFIILHVAAIVFYRVFRRKRLVPAMLSGRSRDYPAGTSPMIAAGAGRLVLCLALAALVTGWIIVGAPPFGS